MATFTRHIINQGGIVSIEIRDSDGGIVELMPVESGMLLDTFSIARLDENGVAAMIEALVRWQECGRLL